MPERKVNLEREVFFLIFSEKNQKKHLPLYEFLLLLKTDLVKKSV